MTTRIACVPSSQAVLSRRFRAAVRLLGAVCAFEGLLSRGLLLPLALGRVVNKSCMPALRAAVAGVGQGGLDTSSALPFLVLMRPRGQAMLLKVCLTLCLIPMF